MGRRSSSTLSLLNAVSDSSRLDAAGSQSVPQRKRLLKAPSLAELDSSDSDVSVACFIEALFHWGDLVESLSISFIRPGQDGSSIR